MATLLTSRFLLNTSASSLVLVNMITRPYIYFNKEYRTSSLCLLSQTMERWVIYCGVWEVVLEREIIVGGVFMYFFVVTAI